MKTFYISTWIKVSFGLLFSLIIILGIQSITHTYSSQELFDLTTRLNIKQRRLLLMTDMLTNARGDLNYIHNDTTATREFMDEKRIGVNKFLANAQENMNAFNNMEDDDKKGQVLEETINRAYHDLVANYKHDTDLLLNYQNHGFENAIQEAAFAKSIDSYTKYNVQRFESFSSQLSAAAHKAVSITLLVLAFGLGLSILTYLNLRNTLLRRLEVTTSHLENIGKGELYHKIETGRQNELGLMLTSLKAMQNSLSHIVNEVQMGTANIDNSAAEIGKGNDDLASRTEEQASALQQTAASMEQIRTTVSKNAENVLCARQSTEKASDIARAGGTVMQQVTETMKRILQSSRKISEINAVIDSIAHQTNILALNAAVEAARAGEQGRGFAVVAGEVRNLAKRSSDAAKEVSQLIRESEENSQTGAELVEQAGSTIQNIIQAVTQVNQLMDDVSIATQEQSAGIDQIATAITEMDITTQQNAALVEETAVVSNNMSEMARQLNISMGAFKLNASAGAAENGL